MVAVAPGSLAIHTVNCTMPAGGAAVVSFSKTDALALFFVCLGATAFLVNAKNMEQDFTQEELQGLFYEPTTLACFLVAVILA